MIAGKEADIKRHFSKKAVAYNRVFDPKQPFSSQVLVDLAKFCKAHDSTFNPDPHVQSMLEGRRQVWLHIMENLQLSDDEIYLLHRVREIK